MKFLIYAIVSFEVIVMMRSLPLKCVKKKFFYLIITKTLMFSFLLAGKPVENVSSKSSVEDQVSAVQNHVLPSDETETNAGVDSDDFVDIDTDDVSDGASVSSEASTCSQSNIRTFTVNLSKDYLVTLSHIHFSFKVSLVILVAYRAQLEKFNSMTKREYSQLRCKLSFIL